MIGRTRALSLLAISLALAAAGCGGGGKSSLPATPAQLGQKVGVTLTITLGTPPTTQSLNRKPAYVPTSAQSLVIDYIGNVAGATPVPGGATPPSNVITAATVNVTATGTNPPPAGQCFASGGSYTCTVNVTLPVGVIDLYILAYTGTNGTGTFLASSVTTVQVNSNATLTQPGSGTTITLNTLGAALGGVTLGAIAAIVPNGLPNSSIAAGSFPTNTAPNVYSAAGTITATDASNNAIPANNAIQPVTVTDTDTSGASCLVYIPSGASTATPCPFASAASSVTLSNSSDSYAVLYNGKFVPAGTLNITAAIASPAPATTPSPITVSITPTTFSTGSVAFASGMGPHGDLVYDPTSKAVYVSLCDSAHPLYKIPYSTTTGYGTPAPVAVTSVNGNSASALSATGGSSCAGGGASLVLGPDGNIWMTESVGYSTTEYVAVYALNSSVINPATGGTIAAGPGAFAEYALSADTGGPMKGLTSFSGFIYAFNAYGDAWRINPATGSVNPNLAAAYAPGQAATTALQMTAPSGGATTFNTDHSGFIYGHFVVVGGAFWTTDDGPRHLLKISIDSSATPSAGICSSAGPPPCIATYTDSTASINYGLGLTTDGTNIYVVDASNDLSQFTQSMSQTLAAQPYSGSVANGLVQTPDGWFWVVHQNGAQAIMSMTSTAAPVQTANNAPCHSQYTYAGRPIGTIIGPDGTLLIVPYNPAGGVTASPLCGVVY